MISTVPVAALAPLDYRYALDAAMAVLPAKTAPIVRCNIPALVGEIHQRIPYWSETRPATAGLWLEPLAGTWRTDLVALANALPIGAQLAVVASRPLARLLPERRSWDGQPLGLRPGGVAWLRRALVRANFALRASYGIHSVSAIGLNLLSRQAERWGRPDLGDRLGFKARLCYCTTGPYAALATVALLIASKERD
jgi:hypothetical protein